MRARDFFVNEAVVDAAIIILASGFLGFPEVVGAGPDASAVLPKYGSRAHGAVAEGAPAISPARHAVRSKPRAIGGCGARGAEWGSVRGRRGAKGSNHEDSSD